jgi:phosphotransferase family enzyme
VPYDRGMVGEKLARCLEAADFGALAELYAPDALFDALVPGRRVTLHGGEAVAALLTGWWPTPGRLTRWDLEEFPSGVVVEFEREVGDDLWRQRHFLTLEGGLVVRHHAYAARPQGRGKVTVEGPLPPGYDVVEREPLTHPGQSGNRLERIRARDGTTFVLKHLVPEGDWIAEGTRDEGRELSFWREGVFDRLPAVIDHCVVDSYDRTLVLRDASADLIAPERRLSREESRRLLAAAGALHREFLGEEIGGAAALADRIRFMGREALRPHAYGLDYIPKVIYVGWEVFADECPPDVVEAVFAAHANPHPLAEELESYGKTLIQGDLRWANLGLTEDRVVMLDWGATGYGPPAVDFAWYLFVNGRRIDCSYDDLIEDFRAAEGDLHDERALGLSWLAQLCFHGGLLAHELIESDAAKRETARRELDWWCRAATRALG